MRPPANPAASNGSLVAAGERAWDELHRQSQPGLIGRDRLRDPYLAGKVLERWLMRCIANRT